MHIHTPTPEQTGQLLCPQYPGASPQCVAMTPREESPAAARAMASDLGCKLPLWLSPNALTAQRVAAVVPLLTLEEKAAQLVNGAPAVPRLGLPAYNWWAEALHGVAFSGLATTFPQVIGLGATFNRTLWHTIGTIIANEGRGKYVILSHGSVGSVHNLIPCLVLLVNPAPGTTSMFGKAVAGLLGQASPSMLPTSTYSVTQGKTTLHTSSPTTTLRSNANPSPPHPTTTTDGAEAKRRQVPAGSINSSLVFGSFSHPHTHLTAR